jgi:YHS domain-containing protein
VALTCGYARRSNLCMIDLGGVVGRRPHRSELIFRRDGTIVAIRPRPERSPAGEAARVVIGVAIDPVCGMTVATVDTSLHMEHEGRTVWFCRSGCLRAFADNPTAFISV